MYTSHSCQSPLQFFLQFGELCWLLKEKHKRGAQLNHLEQGELDHADHRGSQFKAWKLLKSHPLF